MRSKLFILTAVLVLAFSGYALAHCGHCGIPAAEADEGADSTAAVHQHDEAVTATGESICLCGMAVKAGEGVTVEYEGKTYTFCSQACADQFNKNPKTALEAMTKSAAPAAPAAPAADAGAAY